MKSLQLMKYKQQSLLIFNEILKIEHFVVKQNTTNVILTISWHPVLVESSWGPCYIHVVICAPVPA